MAVKDRLRSGLAKRLMRAGVQPYLANSIAAANYPFDDADVMRIIAPRVTGQATWDITKRFLQSPTSDGLIALTEYLFGMGPNEYMRSPVANEERDSQEMSESPPRAPETKAKVPRRKTIADEDGEEVVATGGLRFGADREPVAQLVITGEIADSLGWALVPLAATLKALASVQPQDRLALGDDLARGLLRLVRNRLLLEEAHWAEIEDMDDATGRFVIKRVSTGDFRIDLGAGWDDREDRPAEITQRVAYQEAYKNIDDYVVDQALIRAGGELLDRLDADVSQFEQYDRALAWSLFVHGYVEYQASIGEIADS